MDSHADIPTPSAGGARPARGSASARRLGTRSYRQRRRRRRNDEFHAPRRDQFLGQDLPPLARRSLLSTEPAGAAPQEATPNSLYERISSVETLTAAWETVLARDARDGMLQKQTRAIVGDLDHFLAELSTSLRDGTYVPEPFMRLDIPKREPGETRALHIPSIRDRIVERAVLDTIAHTADLLMSTCSFAYRTGIGTDDAIDLLATLRDDGYKYVLRTDVEDYFPNAEVEDALAVLSPVLRCARTINLIRLLARPRRAHGERRVRGRGIAQGSCLSPLLANLALADVDAALCDAGYGYARFADDIVVCAPNEDDLLSAYDLLSAKVAAHGLSLNQEKTSMTTLDEGFCYLGVDFSRTRPAVDPHHDIKGHPNPDKVVYVGRDGARLHVTKGRLIVDGADGLPQVSIPRQAVSRIVLTGAVGLSAGARSWALYNDIDVVFLSRRGSYLGQLSGLRDTANARRLLTQAAFAADDGARLPLARAIVRAKLRHQIGVLHRIGRRDSGADIEGTCTAIRELAEDAAHATDTDELMGLEGAASTDYFEALSRLVPEDVAFQGRSRRPPKDLANAAFSYAYAILLSECTGALIAAGLEPSLGVLHASTDKRPSLSLDLMEEFRPLLVDRTVMALLRSRRLRPEHATNSPDGEGVWLGPEGKRALVDGYEATLQRQVKGALPGFAGTWRRHIHHQAQLLGRAITEPGYEWTGAAWR
ncbi:MULTISPECIES: CRISPR-associated endonuclease Cas1 [unclassified Actinomyces]|uniref:CRISPR-associated endonuclease Cas1 n=1 Tax=unclassified Actinomyces TaxID=2609248 RepID=UPI00131F2B27|nr:MULTISPECIES: CRISPR-associated endonuclease Cas1 [unclassified Actinomyces]